MRVTAASALALSAAVIAVLVLAFSIARSGPAPGGPEERGCEVVVYTYDSLLKWGLPEEKVNETLDLVYGGFERKTGCRVIRREFEDARAALLALVEERDSPRADVIIGLDNVLVREGISEGVLDVYRPSNLGDVPRWLVQALDPTLHSVPYDYGIVAIVYDSSRVDPDTMRNLTFERLAEEDLASMLVLEDPSLSSTGLSFMMAEIAAYEGILGRNWTEWWAEVRGRAALASSWGEAYDMFLDPSLGRPIVVSYATDPAYSAMYSSIYGGNSTIEAALFEYGGEKWGWLQVEGISLVRGCPHPEAARMFIDYFLSPEVQREIPLNNWMYPANSRVELPEVFKRWAVDPLSVRRFNDLLSPSEISENLKGWLSEWREVYGG